MKVPTVERQIITTITSSNGYVTIQHNNGTLASSAIRINRKEIDISNSLLPELKEVIDHLLVQLELQK